MPQETRGMSVAHAQVIAVIGAQWGDEGKGKFVDALAKDVDICARFNGGANAGHTVVIEGKTFSLHLLPCGILRKECCNVIGNGVVVHLKTLVKELEGLHDLMPDALSRLFLSSRAHLLFDFHQTMDMLSETQKARSGSEDIGTTKKGIGPCYTAKVARTGLRLGDLFHWESFSARYSDAVSDAQRIYNFEHDGKEELGRLKEYFELLRNQIVDTVHFLKMRRDSGARILVEGANATMLDVDFGTYPYVTSSNSSVGGICTGLGIPPSAIECTIGVVKAYMTRVGKGPFPTELHDEIGKRLQRVGRETGTTTGRERRCGWLDAVILRYSCALNGFSLLNLTKLDVLSGLSELKIGVSYFLPDGRELLKGGFPATLRELESVKVQYETMPGWQADITAVKKFDELPQQAKDYIARIEELTNVRIAWVGLGPDRNNTLNLMLD